MKRTAVALTLILALSVSIAAGMQALEVAKANFLPAPAVIIYSPAPIIYTNNSVQLNVGVNVLTGDPEIVYIRYSIDGNANVTLSDLMKTGQEYFAPNKTGYTFHVYETLNNLAEGNHTLKVYSQDAAGKEMSFSTEFTINTHYKYPQVTILSPQNKTYTTTEVPLTWTCDEQIKSANYFLDEPLYGSTTLLGNTTLTGLSNGTHTITVYAFTQKGQANSQTVYFTVNPETHQQTEPLPTTLLLALLIASVIAVTGLLVYFKKHKH
jgi:hypothetical protein